MSRQQKSAPRKMHSRSGQRGWLSFFTGLALGLFVAFLVYLNASTPVRDATTETPTARVEAPSTLPSPAPDSTNGKKPRFDFYTILPEMEVKVSDWELGKETAPKGTETPPEAKKEVKQLAKPEEKPTPTPARGKEESTVTFLQVGSYQHYEEADKTKARLALVGINADIQPVVINGKDTWYRVKVGPFQDEGKLQSARSRLAENNINYMPVRLKAGNEQKQ